ncbi:MAG: cell division protein FtsA [Acidobacteriia bacterium]|nr:cell division protein FtsA [Terriglobia bacterium]
MAVSKKDRIVCGLDVGTDKVCCLIARVRQDDCLEVLGIGYAQSAGLKKGVVVNLEEAASAIRRAAQEAELKSSHSVDWVIVGVSGDHIQSFNCHGAVSINGKHHEVTADDVAQVIRAAQTVPITPEREVIHVLPQEFFLDNRGDIRNAVGLTGLRLDVDVHVVTCDNSLTQNLINAVNKAQMRVRKVVLPQLASAQAVLTPDEKELGTALIDIGAGTTDIALITRDAIRYSYVLPVGGLHFTWDLAVGLRTPIEEAERIKKEFGCVLVEQIADDEVIEFAGLATRAIRDLPRRTVCAILQARAVEVLELIKDRIGHSGFGDQLVSGVVLTGGGSMLDGMIPLAEKILEMPVRQGMPHNLPGLAEELVHPVFATAVGLAMFAIPAGGERRTHPGKASTTPWFVSRFLSWVGS